MVLRILPVVLPPEVWGQYSAVQAQLQGPRLAGHLHITC